MDKTTLAYIKKDHSYLMLYRNKKLNDMNEGKWIGVGGHIEEGETKDHAMKREIKEETNLDVISYKEKGLIHFVNDDYEEDMYLYIVDKIEGELKECDEGTLKYIDIDEVMSLPMWEGDKIFLPLLLKDEPYFELTLIYKGKNLVESIKNN